MKAFLLYAVLFVAALLVLPMLALGFNLDTGSAEAQVHEPRLPAANSTSEVEPVSQSDADSEEDEPPLPEPDETEEEAGALDSGELPLSAFGTGGFKILDESSGQVVEVSVRDFVRGAVAAEMPVSFHVEALKAQAVAAHTYAIHNRLVQSDNPDPELKGADFKADPGNLKVYITEDIARGFYGESADRSWNKICEAADSVLDIVLEYDDEPIVAAYHAISAGQTEDASNVWTGSAPYLVAADSGGDLLAPDYQSTVIFSEEEIRSAFAAAYPDIALGEDPAGWFGNAERSGSGYVTEIRVGDSTLHGKEIRQMLDLRSHNFEVAYASGRFTFTVYGYGHGVGLSQYGADFLARQGYTFDEILANYYPGAALKRVEIPA